MNVDFALVLVLATLVSGLIWLLDRLLFAPKRRAALAAGAAPADAPSDARQSTPDPILVEYAKSFFPVLLIVLVLRSFIFEPFRIPSGSMIPTLLVGDFILVNKFTYGIRLPVTNTKILDLSTPKSGDVAVFRFPRDPSLDYIKRIIGVPGDRIRYYNKTLTINGQPVPVEKIGLFQPPEASSPAQNLLELKENLQGVEHRALVSLDKRVINGEWVVPEGHYFVMGDNRDNSNDSRFWGYVPEENLVGKAMIIWMHWNWNTGGLAWERLGNRIL
ncbi:MAG TPA: signal peptidase I [Gammaproteobacteria bacterium]|jgi:signal peptidase I|nr:signal peptidase I [Gammaproteobacteria bacterium]